MDNRRASSHTTRERAATRAQRAGRRWSDADLSHEKILEGALQAVFIADVQTMRFRWVNAAACALLGYTRDELRTRGVPDIHPADELPQILDNFSIRSVGGGVSRSIPVVRKDGTRLLVDINASRAEIDGVPCLVGFFTDVTEARRAEVHIRKLARAVEQTSNGVIITDADGTIEYVNPAFEQLSGWSSDEAVGLNPRIVKSGRQSDAFYQGLWRRLTRGSVWRGTFFNRRKDGDLYEVQATISPLLGPDGGISGFVGVERDVTAIRAAQSALAAQYRERAQAAAALGRLQPGPTATATAADLRRAACPPRLRRGHRLRLRGAGVRDRARPWWAWRDSSRHRPTGPRSARPVPVRAGVTRPLGRGVAGPARGRAIRDGHGGDGHEGSRVRTHPQRG